MMDNSEFTAERMELEEVLVRQFRALQELIALTKKERTYLMTDPESLVQVVEDKEVLLDTIGLLEDRCRKIIQDISLSVDWHSEKTSVKDLLPFFKPEDANRIRNLSEGITSLASQAREINRTNQAIAATKMDWLKATQEFLISIFQPEAGYHSHKTAQYNRESAGVGIEIRI